MASSAIESNFSMRPYRATVNVFSASDSPAGAFANAAVSGRRRARHVDVAAAERANDEHAFDAASRPASPAAGRRDDWSHTRRRCAARRARGRRAPASSRRGWRAALRRAPSRPRRESCAGRGARSRPPTSAPCAAACRSASRSPTTPARPNRMPATVCSRLARDSRFSIAGEHRRRRFANVAGVVGHERDQAHRRARQRVRLIAALRGVAAGRPCSRCGTKSRAAESSRRCRTRPRRSGAGDSRTGRIACPASPDRRHACRPSTSNGGSCTTVGSSFEKSATTLLASVSTTAHVSVRPNDSPVRTALVDVRHQQVIGSTSTMSIAGGLRALGLGAWAEQASAAAINARHR